MDFTVPPLPQQATAPQGFALSSSQSSQTTSRSRGRAAKRSSRRGDNFRKTPKSQGRELLFDEHGRFVSPSASANGSSCGSTISNPSERSKSATPSKKTRAPAISAPLPAAPELDKRSNISLHGRSPSSSATSCSRGRPATSTNRHADHLRKTPKGRDNVRPINARGQFVSPSTLPGWTSPSGSRSNVPSEPLRSASSPATTRGGTVGAQVHSSLTRTGRVDASRRALNFDRTVPPTKDHQTATANEASTSATAGSGIPDATDDEVALCGADQLQDTEQCAPEETTAAEEADGSPTTTTLPDPTDDPVYAMVLERVTAAMEMVAACSKDAPQPAEPNSTTVVADVSLNLPLIELQRQLELLASSKGLRVCLLNAHAGQARLEGFLDDFNLFLGKEDEFEHVAQGTTNYDVLQGADVFFVDNANKIADSSWRYFLSCVSYVKYGDASVDPAGKVVFVLLGDNKLHTDENVKKVTAPGALHGATLCRSSLADVAHPTQHIRAQFNRLLDMARGLTVEPQRVLDHQDPFLRILAEGPYDIDQLIAELVTTALGEFPAADEVLQFSCYDVPSFRLPGAMSLYEFLAFRGQRCSPDWTPSEPFQQITKEKQR